MRRRRVNSWLVVLLLSAACGPEPERKPLAREVDPHSHANPDEVRVRHLDLDWEVLFDQKVLKGTATLSLERIYGRAPLVLDTRDLSIGKVEVSSDGLSWAQTQFEVGQADRLLGAPLRIQLPATAGQVRIHYSTSPRASGLQWLAPEQTAGKQHPFLYTQSQPIHARSWIPLQDTPAVRVTYAARVRAPKALLTVMSAGNDPEPHRDGEYVLRMPQPVPSYLIALAVGDMAFRPLGKRTGVYAERPVVDRAAAEFEDLEKMLEAAEAIFGQYQWGRYDILVLPPSFPYGGMENPRLTFAAQTVLAGDKSLAGLVAHEMAHSWSGNLVTNATWNDFWLNEGVTVYLARRILERVYGRERAAVDEVLGRQALEEELAQLEDRDELLRLDLRGRNPEEGTTQVAYQKGALLLKTLEQSYGRDRFDAFLTGYFERFAFQSITTGRFAEFLKERLMGPADARGRAQLEEWLSKPGIPAGAWRPSSEALARVREGAASWQRGETRAAKLGAESWSAQQKLHFLRLLPKQLTDGQMKELDLAFGFTRTGNAEILCEWLERTVRSEYREAYPRLEEFLMSVGRKRYLARLYGELVRTPKGKERAARIFRAARHGYHPIAVAAVDAILAPR